MFPLEGLDSTLSILLFRDVTNSKELRQKLIAAEVEPEFAFINASAVLGLLPLQLAAYKALANERRGKMISKTLHTELVYNLSGSRHIGESLRRFGMQDDTASLLVARIGATPADLEYIRGLVAGREVPLEQLAEVEDAAVASKFFKITKEELAVGTAEEAVACRIAVRDCL